MTSACPCLPVRLGHGAWVWKDQAATPHRVESKRTMGSVLDILALVLLVVAIGTFVLGIYVMGNRDDIAALFCFACGAVLLRSAVDLLRPRSAG